ncbi:hypothetical protein MNAN1_002353 [Malassezia nana]|uniref:Uncharacterized protein n=1 Tax=Malassezia nana TaxID=180528 RepID=A0AAF0EJ70_9BASI|nr:hypothetical protein MNAN1_002353 [Malassezia nana]
MLRATLVRGARERAPMIRFPDRKAPKPKHEPHPHPDAPEAIQKDFARFREVLESGPHFDASKLKPFSLKDFEPKSPSKSSSGSAKDAVEHLFDLPERYWNTPSLRFSEKEMDAIQVRMTSSHPSRVARLCWIDVASDRMLSPPWRVGSYLTT